MAKNGGSESIITDQLVERVKNMVEESVSQSKQISLAEISQGNNISISTAWRILRKRLNWYPYKPHAVVPLSLAHKAARKTFCKCLLEQPEGFEENVIWSDEKWFMLKQSPNKQNERFWYPFDPEIEREGRVQGGLNVMAWAGLVNGKVIIHWFDANVSVNGETYLEMLKSVVWPKVGRAVTSRQIWFQQDGASVHTTLQAGAWLQQRFGQRVISRHTDHPWPAKSPDLSPLDYWFWSVAMRELTRVPPSSIEEMKATVEGFADSLDLEEVLKAGGEH